MAMLCDDLLRLSWQRHAVLNEVYIEWVKSGCGVKKRGMRAARTLSGIKRCCHTLPGTGYPEHLLSYGGLEGYRRSVLLFYSSITGDTIARLVRMLRPQKE